MVYTKNGRLRGYESIHGHHIVMKEGGGTYGQLARDILDEYDIKLFATKEELYLATSDELDNMSMAINGWRRIHSHDYAEAVYNRLNTAVQDGLQLNESTELISERVKESLQVMRDILHSGNIFWTE